MATIPERERTFKAALRSLLRQVDSVRVYLNRYEEVPTWLEDLGVEARIGEDIGDRGKFYWCEESTGYQFTVDDDIIYPKDYVERMIDAIEQNGRRACVGVHGALLTRYPISDYYGDRVVFHYRSGLRHACPVHFLGTGTLAWHSSAVSLRRSDFQHPNMADVWFALQAQMQHVGLVCIDREAGWLADAPGIDPMRTIWASRCTASLQTAAVNEWDDWRLWGRGER